MLYEVITRRIPSKIQYFGSLIGLFGVSILILNGKLILELNPIGDLLMIGAVFSWVLYTFVIQKLEKHDNLKVTSVITSYSIHYTKLYENSVPGTVLIWRRPT